MDEEAIDKKLAAIIAAADASGNQEISKLAIEARSLLNEDEDDSDED